MTCDEEGLLNGAERNRMARKVVAALAGLAESDVQSFGGNIAFIGLQSGDVYDRSLTQDEFAKIEAIVTGQVDEPDAPAYVPTSDRRAVARLIKP